MPGKLLSAAGCPVFWRKKRFDINETDEVGVLASALNDMAEDLR